MVRVPSFPVRNNDGARAKFADCGGEAEFVLARGLDVRIGNAKCSAVFYFEDFRGDSGFFSTKLRRAERAHFSGGEVEDSGFVAGLGHLEHGAAAGEFNVVGMSSDGKKIEVHERS